MCAINGLFVGSCAAIAGMIASPGAPRIGIISPAPAGPGKPVVPVEYFLLAWLPLPPLTGPVNPICAAIALLYAFAKRLSDPASDVKVC